MQLKESSYWKWRHKIEEMQHSETKLKVTRLSYSAMEKDLEIMRLKANAYQQIVKAASDACSSLKKEYEDIKLQLEEEIGQSLNGCVIDDVTLEVKKINDDS